MTPRAPYRREWLLLALGTVLAGAFVGYQRFLAHDETRVAEETRLASQARTVADNMQRQLHAVSRVLKSLSDEFPVSVREPAGAVSGRLQLFCDMTGARTLSLYDAQGTILASSRAELVGRNFRERGYFASLPARPDADSLYVSTPFTTALGVYSINVSRVVLGPTGELAGLVSATLDPTYFEVVARSVLYANDMTASFVHGDGTLFFSLPNLPKAVGRNLNQPGAVFTQHMASGQISTVVSATLLVTGSQRMIANHNLRPTELRMDRPLVISVARDLSGIYQGWRWQTELYALVFLAFAGAAGGLLLMSQRRRDARAAEAAMREREREEQAQRNSKELAERLRATQIDLLGTREQLAFAADAARLGLWIRDGATGEVWVSEPGRSLFGFDAAEPVTYERMMQRVHPDDMDAAESAQTSLRDHGRFDGEHRVVLPDGSVRWVSSAGCLRRGEHGGPRSLFAISMDITERKLVEQELQQQRREVAHLSRVVMLGELSGALAHELNQPLTAILSNSQAALRFMAQEPIDLDELRDILTDIVSEDRRAGEVIKRLRRLLTTGEAQRAPLDLNELLGDTVKLLRSDLTGQHVAMVTELEPALPHAWADRVEIQQVLINLVMNACDAMSDLPKAERRLWVRTAKLADDGVQVSVVDHGCGLPGGQADRIFESFYTTKPNGMGLGLSVCRTIITAHRGRLWAENNPDAGSSFHFTLPLADTQPS